MRKSGDISEGKHKQPNAQTAITGQSFHVFFFFDLFAFWPLRSSSGALTVCITAALLG